MKTFSLAGFLCILSLASPGYAAPPDRGGATAPATFESATVVPDGAAVQAVLSFPSVTNARTAKSVPQGTCTPLPTSVTSFTSTDAAAYVFFNISGHANGETLTRVWYSPDGQVAASGSWSPLSSGTGYCLSASLQIAGSSVASTPGTWRVRVYSNMITDVPYVDLTFTVTSGGGGGGFPTVTNAMTAKAVPQGTCTPLPTSVTTFSPTDSAVYVFFNISGQANGETLTRVWYSPDGQVAASGSWSPLSSGGGYCLSASLQISGTSVASTPGTWRVRVFSNMITDVPYVDLAFTVTSGGGGGGFPSVTNAMTAKAVPQGTCTPLPTSVTTFSPTDSAVYVFFNISGQSNGETLTRVWYSPDGQVAASGSWSPLSSGGSYCLSASLQIAGTSVASTPGTWRVRVFSNMITDVPYVDLAFTVTSGGGGGTVAGTWLLTSSARVQGAGAFWQTDLSIRNTGSSSANVTVKFLGHSGDGRGGPERYFTIPVGQTLTWGDALWTLFGLSNEYGPILVRSTTASLAVLGQTWTSGGGGTYGQSVPALATSELIGSTARSILGVRQDAAFRTNLMLANATESTVSVTVQLVSAAGAVLATQTRSLGPLSRDQLNVGNDFGYTNLSDAVFVISSPTSGAAVGAYASVIDNVTQDPRTLLPR
jgi:hypothetical protein